MKDKNNDFNQLKRQLPLIFHNTIIADNENQNENKTIIPTISSKYLRNGKRVAVPFYKSISRMCLSIRNNE